jgi:FAD/FMN-containing dehydrogenase
MTAMDTETLETLRRTVGGAVLGPGEDGFGEATFLWNAMIDHSPALVVQPRDTADVVAAVDFARHRGAAVAVRGGGHNIAGTALADGGVTIDMSRLRAVSVDPERRVATVQPGCQLGDVDRAAQEHGLATPLGFVSEVGVAGLTLGGGLGYLTRRFGWAVDNLLEVEIVTADGRVRHASREEEPDLFWAVRGAGANFGVVTSFTFRLHEVGPTVVGGLVAWPFERADEVLATYRTLTEEAPRELAVWLLLLHAPPAPFVPAEWHGRKICAMAVCYSGDLGTSEEALSPIRMLGDPVLDLLHEQPYVEVQSYLDATEPKGICHYWRTEFLARLDDGLLDAMRDLTAESDLPEAEIGILHIGGALNEREEDDGAVGNRDARYAIGAKAMWAPGGPNGERLPTWVRDAHARLQPFSTGRTYVNFHGHDEDDARVRATYGANYDRLVELKRRYDPENVFRSNRNIAP